MQIALKIDVDTLRGTREGVPALVRALQQAGAGATFLFSLGPDRTGRAIRRVFRKGFIGKVSRTSVLEHYGLRTLLYGTLLPAPDISARAGDQMRAVRDAGFEVGIHCYDHVTWQDFVARRDAEWTARQMRLAAGRFQAVFGAAAQTHGAAGWQMNDAALALEEAFGFAYASDTRGSGPFVPLIGNRRSRVPQLPTTLPTLDELIGLDGVTAENVHQVLLDRTHARGNDPQVFTLHAELEGMKLLPVLVRLLAGWLAQGHELVSMATLCGTLDVTALPACAVVEGTVPGRSGSLACQQA
ncbi:MAG: 4-deoxy-4-formamido-L-arabinose-phosphoundecaprenol deformylase [Proteobacteria bacterium]|nr:4-deoxy-4-formamido-L-arabinose-phosphoundecaprenol deformylase [Pseudomonadota bacterium]